MSFCPQSLMPYKPDLMAMSSLWPIGEAHPQFQFSTKTLVKLVKNSQFPDLFTRIRTDSINTDRSFQHGSMTRKPMRIRALINSLDQSNCYGKPRLVRTFVNYTNFPWETQRKFKKRLLFSNKWSFFELKTPVNGKVPKAFFATALALSPGNSISIEKHPSRIHVSHLPFKKHKHHHTLTIIWGLGWATDFIQRPNM